MFTQTARFYDRLYWFKDYPLAGEQLHSRIQALRPGATRLLDVGCGTGKHLEVLRHHYQAEGIDLNPELLETARERCPDVPFHIADMTDFTLPRTFDVVVILFSAIGYVRTRDNLRKTMDRVARHLQPGGLALVEPWFTPQTYLSGTITANFVNDPDLKIAWMYVSERREALSVLDIHYLVGTPTGIERFNEVHELGLFTHEQYVEAFEQAGMDVQYDAAGFFGRGLYVGTKSSTATGLDVQTP